MRIGWKRAGILLVVIAILLTNILAGNESAFISGAEDQKEVKQSDVTVVPSVTGENTESPSVVSPGLSESLSEVMGPKTVTEQSESTVLKTEETRPSEETKPAEETKPVEETKSSQETKQSEEMKSGETLQSDSETKTKDVTTDSQTESVDEEMPKGDSSIKWKKGKLTYHDDQVRVAVTYTETAKFPVGTKLVVERIPEDSEEYQKYYAETEAWAKERYPENKVKDEKKANAEGQSSASKEEIRLKAYSLFDISFQVNGKKVEPADAVEVILNFQKDEFADPKDKLMVLHHDKEKKEAELPQSQDATVNKEGKVTVEFKNDSFSPYGVAAFRAAPGQFDVVFDGTLGMGEKWSLVKQAKYILKETTTEGWGSRVVYAPQPWEVVTGNDKYELRGWININTKEYYQPGQKIQLWDRAVFYADWVPKTYDNKRNDVSYYNDQPDTHSFIKTDVFDYNELFNIHHGVTPTVTREAFTRGNHSSRISATWKETAENAFLFTNWFNFERFYYKQDQHTEMIHQGSLGFVADAKLKTNKYDGGTNSGFNIVSNLVSGHSSSLIKDLFTPSTNASQGRTYVGSGDRLFRYDGTGDHTKRAGFGAGYYYYDSDFYGADYQKSDGNFYIRKKPQMIQQESANGDNWNQDANSRVKSFMPFENGDPIYERSGQTNYWFGMKNEIDFYLPDDAGTNGNLDAFQQHMKFYFSGDDDVWVFVDDVKVLDLGGIHRRVAGSVDFSNGEIKYERDDGNATGQIGQIDRTTLQKIKSGNHKLTIYYLERGSSLSNCAIYFNLAPRYQVELLKQDKNNLTALAKAQFSVYTDKDCTVPARLYESETDKNPKNVFPTGLNGKVNMYGLYANRTYYIKETKAPDGYPNVRDKIITLKIDATGNARLENTDTNFATLQHQGGKTLINLTVKNEKPQRTSIEVKKKWFNEDGSEMTGDYPNQVKVQLFRRYQTTVGGEVTPQPEPDPIPNPGYSVPVNITTQYFGGDNGVNRDDVALTQGDLSKNMVVEAGSSIRLKLDVQKFFSNGQAQNKYVAGIYAVTVNGENRYPTLIDDLSEQNCYIGGTWGNYPPRSVTYDIKDIQTALDIKVTLIGYLSYKRAGYVDVPSVEKTLQITPTVTKPANPTPPTPPQPPTPQPGNQTTVTEKVGEAELLNAGNRWYKKWDNLPVATDKGEKYIYFVTEELVDGYSTSYAPREVVNGLITVTNVRLREIAVKKVWLNFDGSPLKSGMPTQITGRLIQTDKTTDSEKRINFTLSAENGWRKRWRSDDPELGEVQGHKYTYRAEEDTVGGFDITYSPNGIGEGEIKIINKKVTLKLKITKVNDTGTKLQDASFSLYTKPEVTADSLVSAYDNAALSGQPVSTFLTDGNGELQIYGLQAGQYYLKENTPPPGYLPLAGTIGIKIAEDGNVTYQAEANQAGVISKTPSIIFGVTIKNKPNQITIAKTSTTDGTKKLPNAAFSIFTDERCESQDIVAAYDNAALSGAKKTEFVTGQDGKVHIYGLPEGIYYLKEIRAPQGYYLLTEILSFRIDGNGKVKSEGSSGISDGYLSINGLQLTVKDHPIYSLPSAGGIGVHVFTFSGVAIIMTTLLVLIYAKRREGSEE